MEMVYSVHFYAPPSEIRSAEEEMKSLVGAKEDNAVGLSVEV